MPQRNATERSLQASAAPDRHGRRTLHGVAPTATTYYLRPTELWLPHADDPRRFLHPTTIAKISRLDLRARQVVEGFISGMHQSPFFGHSIEFVQHREYTTGDDIRHLDWKVWSKTDRFYIKQYEAETNLRCNLVVDVSESMHYGRGALNKYEYACTIAACLAYLLLPPAGRRRLHHLRRPTSARSSRRAAR